MTLHASRYRAFSRAWAFRPYRQGVSDFLEVLTAQRTVLQAEQSFADSTATISSNLVALYKALGGGWEGTYPEEVAAGVR